MSNRPVIPQPRPSRPPSNSFWTIPALVVEIILIGFMLLWIKK